MARAGVESDIAERVFAHILQGVRGTYDRQSYIEEKREALQRLANLLHMILKPPQANVVPIRERRRQRRKPDRRG